MHLTSRTSLPALLVVLSVWLPNRSQAQNPDVEVLFWISSYQINSYSAHILIANHSDAPIERWRLSFQLDAPIGFVNYALWSQIGTQVEIEGTGWTRMIPAGDSIWFNLSIGWESEIHTPHDAVFNEQAVQLVTNFEDDGNPDEDGNPDDGGPPDDGTPDDGGFGNPGDVAVQFWYSSVWEDGFVGWMSIRNVGSTPIRGWGLTFTFPHRITILWNGRLQVAASRHTVFDEGWNRTIAPGDSAWFGFQGTYSGVLREPSGCEFNSVDCTMRQAGPQNSLALAAGGEPAPSTYSLDVYPNPGPETVRFSVDRSQSVRLELLDVSGRVVQRLYDASVAAGQVETVSLKTSGLAAGMYVIRMTGSAGLSSHRAVLAIGR